LNRDVIGEEMTRQRDRAEEYLATGAMNVSHPRARLRRERLDDDLLEVPVSVLQLREEFE
jgi:hypothetical protein